SSCSPHYLFSDFYVRRLQTPTLFPYTTLFRSVHDVRGVRPPRRLDVQPAREVAEGDARGDPVAPADRLAHLPAQLTRLAAGPQRDRKSTRLNSSHQIISYAVFCLKKKTTKHTT